MEQAGMPGLQAVVVKEGKIVWSGSYGDAVLDVPGPRRPMRDDYFNMIGSTGKILVAIAVMQQVEKGRFSLDDDVNPHLPFRVRNPHWPEIPITWRMLLTHTSSIDEVDAATYDSMYTYGKDDPQTFGDFMKERFEATGKYKGQNLYHIGKPGTERMYSNQGIDLAALAVEHIAQESFATYVQNEILAPLKMHDTSYYLAPLPADRLSVGYVVERKPDGKFSYLLQRTFLEHRPPSGTVRDSQISFPEYPAGRIYTTATDYVRLMMMFLNKGTLDGSRVLGETSVSLMMTPTGFRTPDGWAQGLGIIGPTDLRGRQVWGHVGEDHSCSSAFYFNPETHVGAIAFVNGNYPDFSLVYAVQDLDLHLISWFENSD
jgi:CubicO group peptidase (beta-lactamase class C family)